VPQADDPWQGDLRGGQWDRLASHGRVKGSELRC
jgi:hypothetical protein